MQAFWSENKVITVKKSTDCTIVLKDWDTLIEQSVTVTWLLSQKSTTADLWKIV